MHGTEKIADGLTVPVEPRQGISRQQAMLLAIANIVVVGLLMGGFSSGYMTFVVAMIAMNVVVGVGLNVLVGLSGQVSFGHVGFFSIGAYTVGILMGQGVDFWLALPAAGLLAMAVGALLALPALRVSGPYLAMMTIAFAFIVEHGTIEWRGLTGGANGLMAFTSPEIFGHPMRERELAILAVAMAGLALLFFQRLARGTWGMAMCAVRDSEVAAQSLGLDPTSVKTASFALSALLTGLAGAIFTPLLGFISPGSFPFSQSILFLFAVVVGGAGTVLGPVIGAAIVVLLPEALSGMAEYRLLLFGALMLAVLWAAPQGIVGAFAARLIRENPRKAADQGIDLAAVLRPKDTARNALEVEGIGIAFGGVRAAADVSFVAEPGKITSVIGPNGAGKTTVLNMIGGFYKPGEGSIRLGTELAGAAAWRVARTGISRTYQTTQLFEQMSVLDNLCIAQRRGRLGGLFAAAAAADRTALAEQLLAFVGYTGPVGRLAGALPHVDRRLVEIARALATRPSVLLLDEPAAGLMRADKENLAALLQRIAGLGIAIILVEHDMSLVMGISDHVVVLDAGRPIAAGPPAAVRQEPRVLEAYLGGSDYAGRPRSEAWTAEQVAVLTTKDLTAGYGAAPVLEDADIVVNPGEMVAVLGANGAGKSTMLRAICGLHRPVQGSVLLKDREIATEAAHDIARSGLALVPEGRQVFPELTTLDNILLGAYRRTSLELEKDVEALLERFPRLRDRLSSPAGVLSGGEQQMLAIARGLIAEPEILLLDEPSLGLAPAMVAELYDILADLRDEGCTILIVDQMANLAMAVADRGYVLESGRVVHAGTAADLKDDPAIEKAYLGHG